MSDCKTKALFGIATQGNKKINICPLSFVPDKGLKLLVKDRVGMDNFCRVRLALRSKKACYWLGVQSVHDSPESVNCPGQAAALLEFKTVRRTRAHSPERNDATDRKNRNNCTTDIRGCKVLGALLLRDAAPYGEYGIAPRLSFRHH